MDYGPPWYQAVAREFDLISPMMPLVLDPDSVEPLYVQALAGAEAAAYGGYSEDVPEEDVEAEAARRTAAAVALLAYGGGWDAHAREDRLAEAAAARWREERDEELRNA